VIHRLDGRVALEDGVADLDGAQPRPLSLDEV
jgi:hypothetical protein